MSLLDEDISENIKDLFPKLVSYDGFLSFLDKLPEQTRYMKKKLVLNVDQPYNKEIV